MKNLLVLLGVLLTAVGGFLIYQGIPQTATDHGKVSTGGFGGYFSPDGSLISTLSLYLNDGTAYILIADDFTPALPSGDIVAFFQAHPDVSVIYRTDEASPVPPLVLGNQRIIAFSLTVQLTVFDQNGHSLTTFTSCEYTDTCPNKINLKRDIGIGLLIVGPLLFIPSGVLILRQRMRARKQRVSEQPGTAPTVEQLLLQLTYPDSRVRARAIVDLTKQPDPRAVKPLIAALQDEDEAVRKNAEAALSVLLHQPDFPDKAEIEQALQAHRQQ